jgi:hypothetical protein
MVARRLAATLYCSAVLSTAAAAAAAPPAVAAAAAAAPGLRPWSWDTMQTFVHCSNHSGPLNGEIVALMANSSFTVIEKYQCLECAPNQTGAEEKVLAAAAQIRAADPTAPIFFYFAVDFTRRWYDLGVWFDAHPELELHDADGSLTQVESNDDGDNHWHVFDFTQPAAVAKWAADIAAVVTKGALDGVFIDGYRGTGDTQGWSIIAKANASTKAAWVKGAWGETGPALAKAIPNTIRLPNGNSLAHPYVDRPPGYNAISIEFFNAAQISLLQKLALHETFVEVHSYIGDNPGLFNATLAAYLVAVGENAYFGAGNTWDTCESWLVDYQIAQYSKPLGKPLGIANQTVSMAGETVYTRKFASGTHVKLTVPEGKKAKPASCVWWSDGSTVGNACSAPAGL